MGLRLVGLINFYKGISVDLYNFNIKYELNKIVNYTKYNVIVTIESSLGYEMLIRKKKVAFFNTHENTHPINTLYFGWPRKKAISGPFWSNKFNQNEIKRILDYLIAINNEEWNRIREWNSKNLISLHNNNNKFIQLMKKEGMKDCLNLLN